MLALPENGKGAAVMFSRSVLPLAPALGRFVRMLLWCAFLVLPALCFPPLAPVRAEDRAPMGAAALMRLLPTSIFDNTPEPISQDDLDLLLTRGHIDNWVVAESSRNSLRMTATGDSPGEVLVQVLRASPGTIIILGANSGDACAAELWAQKPGGGLVPYAAPPGPSAPEFFALTRNVPRNIIASYSLCLEAGMLEAVPRFWNAAGPVDIAPDNRVFYIWNGEGFVQRVAPAADLGALSPPPAPSSESGQ